MAKKQSVPRDVTAPGVRAAALRRIEDKEAKEAVEAWFSGQVWYDDRNDRAVWRAGSAALEVVMAVAVALPAGALMFAWVNQVGPAIDNALASVGW